MPDTVVENFCILRPPTSSVLGCGCDSVVAFDMFWASGESRIWLRIAETNIAIDYSGRGSRACGSEEGLSC
jgi:hypothetical protein